MYVYVLVLECANVCMCVCVCVWCVCMPISALAHLVRCCCHRSVKRVPRWRAPVCRLSVWRWRHHGLSRKLGSEVWKGEKASVGSIHPSVHPSTFPRPNRKPGAARAGRGERGEGKVERERHRERERERETVWVRWKSESDICKSAQALWGSFACLHSPGRAKSPAAYFPASRQSATPLKITDEEKETNALKQLAISQNTVIKVFH